MYVYVFVCGVISMLVLYVLCLSEFCRTKSTCLFVFHVIAVGCLSFLVYGLHERFLAIIVLYTGLHCGYFYGIFFL